MERVSGDGFFSYRREIRRKESSKRSQSSSSREFSEVISDTEFASDVEPISDEEAGTLLDAVFAAGDRLKRQKDTKAFADYRAAVRSFMTAVVGTSITVEERTSGSTIHRRKRYSLIQVIDAKLEQLAAGMISAQASQLDLLARVDEINGMLIDLKH